MDKNNAYYPDILFSMIAIVLRNLEIDGDTESYWKLIGTLAYQASDYSPEIQQYLLRSGAIVEDGSGGFGVNVEVLKEVFKTFEEGLIAQTMSSFSQNDNEEENTIPVLQGGKTGKSKRLMTVGGMGFHVSDPNESESGLMEVSIISNQTPRKSIRARRRARGRRKAAAKNE